MGIWDVQLCKDEDEFEEKKEKFFSSFKELLIENKIKKKDINELLEEYIVDDFDNDPFTIARIGYNTLSGADILTDKQYKKILPEYTKLVASIFSPITDSGFYTEVLTTLVLQDKDCYDDNSILGDEGCLEALFNAKSIKDIDTILKASKDWFVEISPLTKKIVIDIAKKYFKK